MSVWRKAGGLKVCWQKDHSGRRALPRQSSRMMIYFPLLYNFLNSSRAHSLSHKVKNYVGAGDSIYLILKGSCLRTRMWDLVVCTICCGYKHRIPVSFSSSKSSPGLAVCYSNNKSTQVNKYQSAYLDKANEYITMDVA